jgi:hypothetical protein
MNGRMLLQDLAKPAAIRPHQHQEVCLDRAVMLGTNALPIFCMQPTYTPVYGS